MTNFRALFRLIPLLCALCAFAGNVFAQTDASRDKITEDEIRATIRREAFKNAFLTGNVEEKRSALFEIRNLQSELDSRIALRALKDSSEIVRATAAFSVIFLPKDEAFAALAPNLQDRSELVRRETAYALGKIQNPAAISPLIRVFQNKKEKSVEVKNAAVVALGDVGDVSAIDFLTQLLRQKPEENNEFLRRSAARSIGQIAQIIQIKRSFVVAPENFLPEKFKLHALEKYDNLSIRFPSFRAAVPALTQILQNAREGEDARREAAFALGAIGDAAARAALERNVDTEDYYLAEICREALTKISSADSVQ